MYEAGALTGAFIASFLLSRLAMWLLRSWDGGYAKALAANGAALGLAWLVAGFGFSDGHGWNAAAGLNYLPASIFWLVVDLVRQRPARPASPQPAPRPATAWPKDRSKPFNR
jgi:hypothetical protein